MEILILDRDKRNKVAKTLLAETMYGHLFSRILLPRKNSWLAKSSWSQNLICRECHPLSRSWAGELQLMQGEWKNLHLSPHGKPLSLLTQARDSFLILGAKKKKTLLWLSTFSPKSVDYTHDSFLVLHCLGGCYLIEIKCATMVSHVHSSLSSSSIDSLKREQVKLILTICFT